MTIAIKIEPKIELLQLVAYSKYCSIHTSIHFKIALTAGLARLNVIV